MTKTYLREIVERFLEGQELESFNTKYEFAKRHTWGNAWIPSSEDIAFVATKPTVQQLMDKWGVKTEQSVLKRLGRIMLQK